MPGRFALVSGMHFGVVSVLAAAANSILVLCLITNDVSEKSGYVTWRIEKVYGAADIRRPVMCDVWYVASCRRYVTVSRSYMAYPYDLILPAHLVFPISAVP